MRLFIVFGFGDSCSVRIHDLLCPFGSALRLCKYTIKRASSELKVRYN